MLQPWFKHARFGIFIHWGIYSHGRWAESWPFFNGEVGYDEQSPEQSESNPSLSAIFMKW